MRLFSARSSRLTLSLLLAAFTAISSAQAQQIAITFDDLPTHGSRG